MVDCSVLYAAFALRVSPRAQTPASCRHVASTAIRAMLPGSWTIAESLATHAAACDTGAKGWAPQRQAIVAPVLEGSGGVG